MYTTKKQNRCSDLSRMISSLRSALETREDTVELSAYDARDIYDTVVDLRRGDVVDKIRSLAFELGGKAKISRDDAEFTKYCLETLLDSKLHPPEPPTPPSYYARCDARCAYV
jgi:hypothetical protein